MVGAMAKLSVQECKPYLSGLDLTDKQIENLRDNLTLIVNAVLKVVLRNGK